jgi:uncharacterized protein Veg
MGTQRKSVKGMLGLVLLGLVLIGGGARAQSDKETNPHLLEPKLKSVSVFKNGLGFFVREGEVELRDGWCVADKVPPATFGTLAVYSLTEGAQVDIVGVGKGERVDFNEIDAADDEPTIRARLGQVLNLQVELGYKNQGKDLTAAGRLVDVGAQFVILDNGSSNFAVPVKSVKYYQLLDKTMRIHLSNEAGDAPAKGKVRVGVAHLQKGVTWIPDYTLRILDDKTAELICRGTLVNEAEDIINCDVNFVVGMPHFVHTDHLAPLAVGQVIRSLGATIPHPDVSQAIMNRSQMVYNVAPQIQASDSVIQEQSVGGPTDLSGMIQGLPMNVGAAMDHTVYTKKGLTVRKGEKALVTLFKTTIRYGHIYRWNTTGEVEHFFVLRNDTASAWTTGPCLGLENMHPITEDLLKYTPVGSSAELKVSSAINVRFGKQERETDRKLKAHSPGPNVFLDLVTLQGTLMLQNHEKQEATIVIVAPVPGNPVEASDKGDPRLDTSKLVLTDRQGTVTWTLKLKPGESKNLTYVYERYVPSR